MVDQTNSPPPENVRLAAAIVDKWVREQEQAQPRPEPVCVVETAIAKFTRTIRPDDPPQMPPWSAATVVPGLDLRAADRFMQQRRDRSDKPAPMPPWRDPRGSA